MDVKCKGDCRHIVEEDLKNLRDMRNIKQNGGNTFLPMVDQEERSVHRCPQCNEIYQNKTAIEQHVKEIRKCSSFKKTH